MERADGGRGVAADDADAAEEPIASDREAIRAKLAELRSLRFSTARRGYDRDEVTAYLRQLASWLEGTALTDPDQVRRELSLVGERTSEILTKADETARELRGEAQKSAEETVDGAREEAERLAAEAEEDARHVRLEADAKAVQIVEDAERRAEQLTDEALRRRRAFETVIEDLVGRRDEIVGEIQRLVLELSDIVEAEEAAEELAPDGDEEAEELEPDEAAELEPVEAEGEALEAAGDESEDPGERASPSAP